LTGLVGLGKSSELSVREAEDEYGRLSASE